MRYPADKIRQAILSDQEEIRLTALEYFTSSAACDDPSVMPVVIQAVERQGLKGSFSLLRAAEDLPQTPQTLDWLIDQLRREFDASDREEDNLRVALGILLCQADPDLLARRHGDILGLPAFPEPLRKRLDETLKLEFCDWSALWQMFEEHGRRTLAWRQQSRSDHQRQHRLMRAMARHPDADHGRVLALLAGDYAGHDQDLIDWLQPGIVELAGRLRLRQAIPILLDRLDAGDEEAVEDEIGSALSRIGNDEVIAAVSRAWRNADVELKFTLVQPLGEIHSAFALEQGLTLLQEEEDDLVQESLGLALLDQFATETIQPVRELLPDAAGDDAMHGDYWDLRYKLIATATTMGVSFRDYEAWYADAVATNFGYDRIKDRIEPSWLVDSIDDDGGEGPRRAIRRMPGPVKTVYQLKVTLKHISPPVWRRLLVPDCSLDDLHEAIQIAMGWDSYHLYSFEVGEVEFTHPEMDDGELNMLDATSTRLSKILKKPRQKFEYLYDFGDGWRHEVLVEKIEQPKVISLSPECIGGRRACPPEDVGGIYGYDEYLKAMADPDHERHEEWLGWRGPFEPEVFDAAAVNRELRRVFR